MVQIRQPVQEGEKPDLFVAQQTAQMHNPMEEIVLDAGAANQQGNGVNENAHADLCDRSSCHFRMLFAMRHFRDRFNPRGRTQGSFVRRTPADRLVEWAGTCDQAGCDPVPGGCRVCLLYCGGISFAAGWSSPVDAPAGPQALYGYDRDCPAGRLQRRELDTDKAGIDLAARLSPVAHADRSEEHTSELQSPMYLV